VPRTPMRLHWVLAGLALALVVTGCSDDAPGVDVLARSGTLPADVSEEPVVAVADTAGEVLEAWGRFGFGGEPTVSVEEHGVVLFVGTVESGSCPATVEFVGSPPEDSDVEWDLLVTLGHDGGPDCTTDANPVTLVVAAPGSAAARTDYVANETVTSPLSAEVTVEEPQASDG